MCEGGEPRGAGEKGGSRLQAVLDWSEFLAVQPLWMHQWNPQGAPLVREQEGAGATALFPSWLLTSFHPESQFLSTRLVILAQALVDVVPASPVVAMAASP